MKTFAYCRVSTTGQDTTMQVEAIKKSYPDAIIFEEKLSGTNADRPELQTILKVISEGERLVVWKLDRLARNMEDLLKIVTLLDNKRAALEILDQKIDTSTASGKAFLQMLGVFSEFETNLRYERQVAGIEKAKAAGKYKGRKRQFDRDAVLEFLQQGNSLSKTAEKFDCSVSTVKRIKREAK